ncbi:hypothetical protein KEM52_005925, partial [Ascosphaera acerosa]
TAIGIEVDVPPTSGAATGAVGAEKERLAHTKARRVSKLRSRIMRRASEQVAQAASYRIAPKTKIALYSPSAEASVDRAAKHLPSTKPIRPGPSDSATSAAATSAPAPSSPERPPKKDAPADATPRHTLTRETPEGPRMYTVIGRAARATCRSTARPKKMCPHPGCSDVHGFCGEHELRRHILREHSDRRPVWVLVDISPEQDVLKDCKKCKAGKRYHAVYNAAEHLRNHLLGRRKQKHLPHEKHTVLPMKKLQPWIKMYEEVHTDDGKVVLVNATDVQKAKPSKHAGSPATTC